MTDHRDASTEVRPKPREVPIEWEALEDAFENNAPEVHSYLHLRTGEVLRIVDGIADPQMHARIAADAEYIRIEPVSSREQYRWMERYIQMLEASPLRQVLQHAIDGKGAFRRFKDVLMSHATERERWFSFRSVRLRAFMEAWLAAHLLEPIERTEPKDGDQTPHAPVEVARVDARPEVSVADKPRSQAREALKRQLMDVVDSMRARDVEKVLAFAEFVRARRAARRFTPALDAEAQSERKPTDGAGARDDEDPPSSRKLPAVR